MSGLPRAFADLREFLTLLESRGQLVRIEAPVDPKWEVTEISRRLLLSGGPAVWFSRVGESRIPMVANLFGTEERVGLAIGRRVEELEAVGERLAELKQPEPPANLQQAWELVQRLSVVRHMRPHQVKSPPCQQVVWSGAEVDLTALPIQTCWPGDVSPLVTWPLVITRAPEGGPLNIGVYRMQLLGRNRLVMRWLPHRGGALHARKYRGRVSMPVAVAIGADPATLLAAVTPVPESLSEYAFAGLLRERAVEVALSNAGGIPVPATAEIVLEGEVNLGELVAEGPFGDHTGYYNEVELFPVFNVHRVTMRRNPIYLSTFTGRPPDEPAILALALNRVFVPLLKKHLPEVTGFHLPAAACSYRMAVVAIDKQYPGHAFRVMTGIWGFLRQFLYTKYIIVVDSGVELTDWDAVMGRVARNVHAARDVKILEHTPIDYLDFASPLPGLGGKMGIDATAKLGVELEVAPVRPDPVSDPAQDWPRATVRAVPYVRDLRVAENGRQVVIQLEKSMPLEGRKAIEAVWRLVPPGGGADQIVAVDGDIDLNEWNDVIWAIATRCDPGRDALVDQGSGRLGLDATTKLPSETTRQWGRGLSMDREIMARVERRWEEFGLR